MTNDVTSPEEKERILLSAIWSGDLGELKYLVGVKGYRGVGMPLVQTAFNCAVASGNVEIAKYLRSCGHRDDGFALKNAIRSKSLAMFRYVTEVLSARFEYSDFSLALEIEWTPARDDEFICAILDKADSCGYFDFRAALNGFSDERGCDIDGLIYAIRNFLRKTAGEYVFYYVLDIIDENCAGEILFRGYNSEVDHGLLISVIESGDLKSFKAIWDRVHKLEFYNAEIENIDSLSGARKLVNHLFEMAAEKGCKEIFDYLAKFADPDCK